MAWSRNRYHYAIRKAKRLANAIRAQELSVAAAKGDLELLEEMKKSLDKKSGWATMQNSLEGVVGEAEIVDKFKELYETLYNSCGTENAMSVIKQKLEAMMNNDTLAEV